MKVAIIHDYLNQLGGGERVLDVLLDMFPQADLYTLLHDAAKTESRYAGRVTKTSFLDFQFARNHHRIFIPLMPFAARSINLGNRYDLIISDTAGFAKGIRYDERHTKHVSYIHTPLRYAWETEAYFRNGVKNWLIKYGGAPVFWYLRQWDKKMAQRPETLLANSQYIAEKIKRYYGRDSTVVYPPVSDSWFQAARPSSASYYLAAGRLLHYKRFDLIIEAFAALQLPLKIVGQGPLFSELQALAKERSAATIEFLGYVKDDEKLRTLYQGAKGFIMANEEDFGLVMAEAQACGAPVIAYGVGGSCEIVEDEKTGIFFSQQTSISLVDAVKRFEKISFDRNAIAQRAERFSRENFKRGIREVIR